MNKSIHTNIRILFVCVVLSVFPRVVSGQQYRFHSEVTSSGNCTGLDHLQGAVFLEASRSMANTYNSMIFSSKAECEATRNSFAGTQNVTGCIVTITCTMCTPIGSSSSSSINTINPSGPTQGSSYFSSNPANEILDWSEDTKRLQEALDINYKELGDSGSYQKYPTGHTSIRINNESFNEARDDSRGIDITKPYAPSQERENTMEEVSYIDNYSVFQEFTQLRNSGELQYETPEEFIEAMIQQSDKLWLEFLRRAKMPYETFMYILNEVLYNISWESNRHNLIYEKELKEAEFRYTLSKYMVEYEKYQISKTLNNLDESDGITDQVTVAYLGKTRDQMAREGMERVAKELFEKYGITEEQLEMARNVVDDKDNYADMVVDFVKDYQIDQLGDGLLNIGTLGNSEISIGSVMDVGLILNKSIVLYGLWQENNTLGDRVQKIKYNHEEFQKLYQDELDKAGTIMTIMDNHYIKEYINNDNTPPSEKVKWALKTYDIIKRIEKNGQNHPEEIFPGKFRQRIRNEVTYIQKMPWE